MAQRMPVVFFGHGDPMVLRHVFPDADISVVQLYILGLRGANEKIRFPVEGIEGGSISMLAVQAG